MGERSAAAGSASDLDREERVTSRRLPDPAERPPGERASQPNLDDLVQRGRAERPQHDTRHLTVGQRLLDLQPGLAVGPDALAGEQANRQPPEPARCEREHPRGRAVEPVQVIDRDQHGRSPCQLRQNADRRGSHGPLIEARTTRILAQQGHRERASLRLGQAAQDIIGHRLEQISERCEREPRLRGDGPCRKDHHGALAGSLADLQPQRRLADPRLAREYESGRAALHRRHECRGGLQLPVAADDLSGHD